MFSRNVTMLIMIIKMIIINNIHNSYYSKQIIWNLKLANLRTSLHILMQKAVILNTCSTVRNFLAEQWIRSVWSVRLVPFRKKKKLNCCEVRNDDDNDGGSSLFIFRPLTVSLASSMTNNCNYICCILPYKFPFKWF